MSDEWEQSSGQRRQGEPGDDSSQRSGAAAQDEAKAGAEQDSGQKGESAGSEESLTLDKALKHLDEAENKLADQHDEMLRIRAEMQNMRRRNEQEVEKARKFGQERFVSELLTVIDNLERALDAVPDKDDANVQPLYQGVELTLKGFLDVLARFNVEQIDPEGEPFDPQFHEALTTQESTDVEPNTVLHVMQKGYSLNGRVIRPARVVVSRGPAPGVSEKA